MLDFAAFHFARVAYLLQARLVKSMCEVSWDFVSVLSLQNLCSSSMKNIDCKSAFTGYL